MRVLLYIIKSINQRHKDFCFEFSLTVKKRLIMKKKILSVSLLFVCCMVPATATPDESKSWCPTHNVCNLIVSNDATVNNNLQVDVDADIAGNLTVDGCLTANCILGNPVMQGNLHVNGTAQIDGNAHVGGNLQVDGDETINGCLTVSCVQGNPVFQDDVTVNGCLTANCFVGGGTFNDTLFSVVDATDATKKVAFDVQGAASTTTTFITNPTVNRNVTLPDTTGTLLVSDAATGIVLINQAASFISNAGIQYSGTTGNRGQIRMNQFGSNTGISGITGFKSRGTTIGSLASVLAGDVLFRATAIGVTGDNASVPLSGLISINAVSVASNYIETEFEVQLVPQAGPINGAKKAFVVTGDGILKVREAANKMAGVATTDATGSVTINNTQVSATSRFTLTIQDTGAVPTGFVYASARVVGTSFTITSSTAQPGVDVYYQIWEPTTPA